LAPYDVAQSNAEQVATEAKPRLTLHAQDRPPAESDLHPGKADLGDHGTSPMRPFRFGSFVGPNFIFCSKTSDQAPKKLMNTSAKDKNESSKGGAQYLKRKKPGTRINVRVCRLLKCAEHGQYLKCHQRKSQWCV
jgi:hypothetical protein